MVTVAEIPTEGNGSTAWNPFRRDIGVF